VKKNNCIPVSWSFTKEVCITANREHNDFENRSSGLPYLFAALIACSGIIISSFLFWTSCTHPTLSNTIYILEYRNSLEYQTTIPCGWYFLMKFTIAAINLESIFTLSGVWFYHEMITLALEILMPKWLNQWSQNILSSKIITYQILWVSCTTWSAPIKYKKEFKKCLLIHLLHQR